jgi:hypothetical protein
MRLFLFVRRTQKRVWAGDNCCYGLLADIPEVRVWQQCIIDAAILSLLLNPTCMSLVVLLSPAEISATPPALGAIRYRCNRGRSLRTHTLCSKSTLAFLRLLLCIGTMQRYTLQEILHIAPTPACKLKAIKNAAELQVRGGLQTVPHASFVQRVRHSLQSCAWALAGGQLDPKLPLLGYYVVRYVYNMH